MRILVDPEDDIQYMSFYLHGLIELFGADCVRFCRKAFASLSDDDRATRSMRFIVQNGVSERRYAIATNDSYRINERLYEWCDVYGSVNANRQKTPEALQGKLVPLCPSFAIRYTQPLAAWTSAIRGVVGTRRSPRKYLGCWKRMLQRQQFEEYTPPKADENYIFHLSTLWRSDEWNRNDDGVNLRRATFIRACKRLSPGVTFEGGLVASKGNTSTMAFADCMAMRQTSLTCLEKTKRSTIVFNTPAYWDCHGWKLGEYMALGKAILSTPLSNDLPAPLVHGTHLHIAGTSEEELLDATTYMLAHSDYRRTLEKNIHTYWQQYGTPTASLRLLGITA